MKKFARQWSGIVGLAMLPGLSSAGAFSGDPVVALSKYARAYDWIQTSQSKPSRLPCATLLKNMQMAQSLRTIAPRIEADDAYNSVLGELSRCSEYKLAERQQAPVPNDFIRGASDLGDQAFRMYRVRPRHSDGASRSVDIVYAEFKEQKVLTNGYVDGFTAVNLAECKRAGRVPVQRPLPRDKSTGATRNFSKGLFDLNGSTYAITTAEQVGHLTDPQSFRSIDAWELEPDGKFLPVCAWAPKSILQNGNLGK